MLTGSVVSGLQGQPRSTHDIDIVVALPAAAVDRLVKSFPAPDYYLSHTAALQAVSNRSMFNLLDLRGGDKVDFWLLTDDPFDQSRFSRKVQQEALGLRIHVSAPEDTILAKLRWDKLSGGSEKQFIDALRVFETQRERLNGTYLNDWAHKLGVEARWSELQDEAEKS